MPNHLISATEGVPARRSAGGRWSSQRLAMLPVECVVRGYLSGSGWNDYRASGAVCGIELPDGPARVRAAAASRCSRRPPRPRSATTTRTSTSRASSRALGDRELAERVRDASIAVYLRAAEHARERGIILADTKFEFGLAPDGTLVLGDEVLTPDSSRFWPADGYEPGRSQPSFDKQPVRDWATASGWDRTPPAPAIPDDVVAEHTRALPRGLRADRRRAAGRLAARAGAPH